MMTTDRSGRLTLEEMETEYFSKASKDEIDLALRFQEEAETRSMRRDFMKTTAGMQFTIIVISALASTILFYLTKSQFALLPLLALSAPLIDASRVIAKCLYWRVYDYKLAKEEYKAKLRGKKQSHRNKPGKRPV